ILVGWKPGSICARPTLAVSWYKSADVLTPAGVVTVVVAVGVNSAGVGSAIWKSGTVGLVATLSARLGARRAIGRSNEPAPSAPSFNTLRLDIVQRCIAFPSVLRDGWRE